MFGKAFATATFLLSWQASLPYPASACSCMGIECIDDSGAFRTLLVVENLLHLDMAHILSLDFAACQDGLRERQLCCQTGKHHGKP